MNPWQYLRREIDGAIRSLRYDLAAKRARRVMRRDTVCLPTIGRRSTPTGRHPATERTTATNGAPAGARRTTATQGAAVGVRRTTTGMGMGNRRLYAAAAVVLLPVAGVSGYFAISSGLDALFPGETAPNGLPATGPNGETPSPAPQSPTGVEPVRGDDPGRGRPAPRTSPAGPVFVTPVPTPAPTCQCTPPPTPTLTPSPSMSEGTTPTMTPMPTPVPSRTRAAGRSPSPRLTSRLRH